MDAEFFEGLPDILKDILKGAEGFDIDGEFDIDDCPTDEEIKEAEVVLKRLADFLNKNRE